MSMNGIFVQVYLRKNLFEGDLNIIKLQFLSHQNPEKLRMISIHKQIVCRHRYLGTGR